MEPFSRLDGIAASLPAANIDTDKILAAAYLKTTLRSGLGKALFSANRYTEDGQENADFVLNQMPWRQTKVLVTGPNFGCGSSREHAPWALLDFGIRCIVAPSFADIFFNNCFKNGILAVTLADDIVAILAADARSPSTAHMVVDLESQTLRRSHGEVILFEVDPARKRSLLLGCDDIDAFLRTLGKSIGPPWQAKQKLAAAAALAHITTEYPDAGAALQEQADHWQALSTRAFFKSYRRAMKEHPLFPFNPATVETLVTLFMVEKAAASLSSALSEKSNKVEILIPQLIQLLRRKR